MRKLIFLLVIVFLIATGCKNNKTTESTMLGPYTPYDAFPEKLIGKVGMVVEKNYWAIPDSNTFKKGNLITIKDRDSLKWTNDFEAKFDVAGDIVSCNYLDENNGSINKWELVKENNILASAKVIIKDTVRIYQKLKCNTKGEIIEISSYRAIADTLMYRATIKYSEKRDTVTRQFYNYKDAPYAKQVYFFNSEGKFLLRESYNKDSEFIGAVEVKYNDKGKISEMTYYDKDKKVVTGNYFTYEYDLKGNWIRATGRDKDLKGKVVIEERTYTYFE